jgi:hypothetical protein
MARTINRVMYEAYDVTTGEPIEHPTDLDNARMVARMEEIVRGEAIKDVGFFTPEALADAVGATRTGVRFHSTVRLTS